MSAIIKSNVVSHALLALGIASVVLAGSVTTAAARKHGEGQHHNSQTRSQLTPQPPIQVGRLRPKQGDDKHHSHKDHHHKHDQSQPKTEPTPQPPGKLRPKRVDATVPYGEPTPQPSGKPRPKRVDTTIPYGAMLARAKVSTVCKGPLCKVPDPTRIPGGPPKAAAIAIQGQIDRNQQVRPSGAPTNAYYDEACQRAIHRPHRCFR